MSEKKLKVALVCDWLTNVGGGEKVLKSIHELYPDAPIYTSKYDKKGIDWFKDADVRTGWLQIFPTKLRRLLGPLRQSYFSHLDLSSYDLIISITGAEAKSIKKGNATHICYCHVPTQYYWQFYDDYVEHPGFGILDPIVRFFFKLLVKPLRKADYKAAQKPDYFITISNYAADLIKKYYKREATIIAPPVEVQRFIQNKDIKAGKSQTKENNKTVKNQAEVIHTPVENSNNIKPYITTSRHVTWKRLDLAVKACLKLKRPLILIGEGPEHKNLVKMAKKSELINFLPVMTQKELKKYLLDAKAYLFPSLEPFGIAPVEALAAGCPVIAFGEGGALDYVLDGKNGILFKKQTVNSLADAILEFEKTFKSTPEKISATSVPFAEEHFKQKMKDFIDGATK